MITIKKPIDEVINEVSNNLNIEAETVKKLVKDVDKLSEKYIYVVSKDCIRCSLCYTECPVDAITKPTVRKPAEIIPDKCVKCEICAMTCPVNAIDVLNSSVNIDKDSVIYNLKEREIEHRTIKLKKYNIDLENCIKCGICARYCPTNAITVIRRESFEVDLNKCVGCKACENVCPKKVINVENELGNIPFKKDIKIDNDLCVKCLTCIEECPVGIISEISEGVEIDKSNCIFCGKCESVCPVHAIKISSKK